MNSKQERKETMGQPDTETKPDTDNKSTFLGSLVRGYPLVFAGWFMHGLALFCSWRWVLSEHMFHNRPLSLSVAVLLVAVVNLLVSQTILQPKNTEPVIDFAKRVIVRVFVSPVVIMGFAWVLRSFLV